MGTYDYVTAKCKDCGGLVEFQTKALGGCGEFVLGDEIPMMVVAALDGAIGTCPDCENAVRLRKHITITLKVDDDP